MSIPIEQKHTDEEYIEAELFEDRDIDVRVETKSIVTTRKEHDCAFGFVIDNPHVIAAKSRAIKETAVVEGKWGSSYSCLPCVDTWLDHLKEIHAA